MKGDNFMEGKILNIEGFKAVGITYIGNNENGEIPSLWDVFNNRFGEIKGVSAPMLCYGICESDGDSECSMVYTASAQVDSFENVPEGMETKVVPSGKYLVYTYTGALKDLGHFYGKIFSEWLPSSGLEIDFRPQLELYDDRFMSSGEFDIYIPIK
jgi:AraC family transcriptional regulator